MESKFIFSQNIHSDFNESSGNYLNEKNSSHIFANEINTKHHLNLLKTDHKFISFFRRNNFKKAAGTNSEPFNFLDVSFKSGYLREIEELYSTNSIYQNLSISKRFSNMFELTLTPSIEYATRDQVESPVLNRWYDNTGLEAEIDFNEFNELSLFASASISDSTFTSYGTSLNSTFYIDEVEINNYLTLSYDYFYYWNQIGQYFGSDNIQVVYDRFNFSVGYFFGVVNLNYVDGYEAKAKNPNSALNLEVQYKLLINPAVNIGIQFNTRDYKYYSPLYYSPQDRNITGISANVFELLGKYFFYFGGGARVDNNGVFIWDIDSEVGLEVNSFSISLGLSRYNDPFYTSYNTFLNLTKGF